MSHLRVRTFTTANAHLWAWCRHVRREVFQAEQRVGVEHDVDAKDAGALHALAFFDGKPVGTARLLRDRNRTAKIGRLCVLREYRQRGVARRLVEHLEGQARKHGAKKITLHAQLARKAFYEKLGYARRGRVYREADIDHVTMTKPPRVRASPLSLSLPNSQYAPSHSSQRNPRVGYAPVRALPR